MQCPHPFAEPVNRLNHALFTHYNLAIVSQEAPAGCSAFGLDKACSNSESADSQYLLHSHLVCRLAMVRGALFAPIIVSNNELSILFIVGTELRYAP